MKKHKLLEKAMRDYPAGTGEIWKGVVGFESFYEVSNLGRVRSVDRKITMVQYGKIIVKPFPGKLLAECPHRDGYVKAGICGRYHYIHRLVAASFIPNSEFKECVNHINGVKNDNRAENLEWSTYTENTKHAFKSGLSKISEKLKAVTSERLKGKPNKHSSKLVIDTETGIFYDSAKEAGDFNLMKPCTIIMRMRRKENYRFKFA